MVFQVVRSGRVLWRLVRGVKKPALGGLWCGDQAIIFEYLFRVVPALAAVWLNPLA